jgi:heme o synthase
MTSLSPKTDAVLEASAKVESGLRAGIRAIVEATKPRITRLVAVTSGVGFVLAAIQRSWAWGELAMLAVSSLAGTVLAAAGANALNQWMERDRDALMPRTCTRPLPEQRLTPAAALGAGSLLAGGGVGVLWLTCGVVPALIALSTVLIYLFLYTPLKPVTPHATLIGAIPGALPPLIGFSAAADGRILDPWALALFAIMFIWQIPHFLAIAWMYRADYAQGGYRVLAVLDESGRRTAASMVWWSAALIPAAVAPAWTMRPAPGIVYTLLAVVMGSAYLRLNLRFAATRERTDARRAFIASVVHLPLLFVMLVACATWSRLL